MRKIKQFWLFSFKKKCLFLEAFILLGWGRIQKTRLFSKSIKNLGDNSRETSYASLTTNRELLSQISEMIYLVSKYTFWETECLVKAIAATNMLRRRGIESTLYLGTGKDENGKLIAHAWVRSGPYILTGFETMEHFTVVATFANYGLPLRSKLHESQ